MVAFRDVICACACAVVVGIAIATYILLDLVDVATNILFGVLVVIALGAIGVVWYRGRPDGPTGEVVDAQSMADIA